MKNGHGMVMLGAFACLSRSKIGFASASNSLRGFFEDTRAHRRRSSSRFLNSPATQLVRTTRLTSAPSRVPAEDQPRTRNPPRPPSPPGARSRSRASIRECTQDNREKCDEETDRPEHDEPGDRELSLAPGLPVSG